MGEVGGPRVYMVRAYINHVIAGLGDVHGAGAGVLYFLHTDYTSVAP